MEADFKCKRRITHTKIFSLCKFETAQEDIPDGAEKKTFFSKGSKK
jgi:hypothetical protein